MLGDSQNFVSFCSDVLPAGRRLLVCRNSLLGRFWNITRFSSEASFAWRTAWVQTFVIRVKDLDASIFGQASTPALHREPVPDITVPATRVDTGAVYTVYTRTGRVIRCQPYPVDTR